MRTGIFGGSFDPPHEGHLRAARAALQSGPLDRVLLVPCGDIPNAGKIHVPAGDRVAMLRLLAEGQPGLSVSEVEAGEARRVPTAETMKVLRARYPMDELFFIIGADKLTTLPDWKNARELFSLCSFLVLPRDGLPVLELAENARRRGASVTVLPMEETPVSSGAIQRELALRRDPAGLPDAVAAYIAGRGLYQERETEEKVRSLMTEKRFRHTLGVRTQAVLLAQKHHLPMQKASWAALLHDCAKCLPFEEMTALARSGGVTDPDLLSSPEMLHGPAGAVLARRDFGVDDPDVLNAIAYHTMGRAGMSPLEMCIFVADATEPGRREYPGLQELRELSYRDLPAAVLLSLACTRRYVEEQGKPFNPLSEKTIAWLEAAGASS